MRKHSAIEFRLEKRRDQLHSAGALLMLGMLVDIKIYTEDSI